MPGRKPGVRRILRVDDDPSAVVRIVTASKPGIRGDSRIGLSAALRSAAVWDVQGARADRVRIVVTGAGGFVGRPLCAALRAGGHRVTAVVRQLPAQPLASDRVVAVGDLATGPDWTGVLDGADCVVHLAGRAHVRDDGDGDAAERAYFAANVGATETVVHAARTAGVRRIVYISSIKVNGERTFGRPFRHDDVASPEDAYGRSKARAEEIVRAASSPAFETVILRPPLIYGPGVRGNIATLFGWAARGLPLPLASIANRRDLVGVSNFVSLIGAALAHPAAAGGTFLARDGEPVSTPALYAAIAEAMGRRARLLPCPPSLLKLAGRLTGRGDTIAKLTGDLEVDDTATRHAP